MSPATLSGSLPQAILAPSCPKAYFKGVGKPIEQNSEKMSRRRLPKVRRIPRYPGRVSVVSAKALESLLELGALPWYALPPLCSHAGSAVFLL